jgi:hypothetical protein
LGNRRVTVFGTAKFYVDGTVSYSESASGFSAVTGSSSDPYILRIYQSVGGVDQLLGELVMQVSITGTYAATTTCDSESVPTTTSIAMSGSISNKENDEDGTAVEDFESSFNNLAITVVSSDLDSVTCEPAVIDVTMSGSSSSTDSLDSSNSIAMSVDSETPLSIHWEDMGTFAEVDVSGTVTIDSSCFDGTLTIATTTPIQVPDSEDDACPVAGVVKVTGSMTGTVTYNSNGSVSVDEGSNGTVDRTLESCDEAETCS